MAIAAIILVPLLLLGVNGFGMKEPRIQVAPPNPAFVDFVKQVAQGTWRRPLTAEGYPLGHIPSPVDLRHLKELSLKKKPKPSPPPPPPPPPPLPSSFDWRNNGGNFVTSVKDQGPCGSCWAFGNLGALEAKYNIQNKIPSDIDLSENNMTSCHWPWLWGRCAGGNTFLATSYLVGLVKETTSQMFPKGALLEGDDPYYAASHDDTLCTTRPDPFLRIEGTRWVAQDEVKMKEAIQSSGPLVTAFYYQDSKYDPSTHVYYYPNCTQSTNHEVLIVGWDDTKPDGHGGYGCWIVKNSWGSEWGDQGYFYIAYGSGNVGDDNMYYTSTRPCSSSENFYLEDLPGWIYSVGWGSSTAYGATVFAVPNLSETLTHVEFYTVANNATYEIKVWNNVSIITSKKTTNITFSGLLATQTGSCQEAGYYSIPLRNQVTLTGGQNYGVEVKFYSPSYNYPLACAAPVGGVIDKFEGMGSSTSYGRGSSSGSYQRLVIGGKTYVPCVRARTTY
jgi:C1A family cysteine protease